MTATIFLAIGALLVVGFAAVAILAAIRGTPVKNVVPRGDDLPPPAGGSVFRRTLEAYVGTALRPGHEVELCDCGDATYPRLFADIRAARRFVVIQMYYAGPGRVADALHEALLDRARAGVDVLFLHDAFGSSLGRAWLESLRAAGVEVAKFRAFHPQTLYRIIHRAHVRAIVIDGEVGWTGGFGIDDKWLGDGRSKGSWRDTNVRFTGPAVTQLLATFGSCWAEATGELIAGTRFWAPPSEAAEDAEDGDGAPGALAGVLHAAPSAGSTPAERLVALTLSGARQRLWLTNAYFVPDDDIRTFLKEAVRRGADVRVLAPGPSSDVRMTYLAARARYEELLECGLRIWEYVPDMIHAKTIVVDGVWSVVGTMNLDNRSMAFNDECSLLVQDAEVASALERMFLADLEHSKEIHLEEFRRRPWWNRPLELAAHGLSRIL